MSYASIRTSVDDRGVATLELARPEKHNALNPEMIAELTTAAARLGADESVRVVVLRGLGSNQGSNAGGSFCAGGDLAWMQAQFTATRQQRLREARALAEMLRALNELPKPLIGAVHGPAYGGGVGLMSVCDAVIAVDTAKFGLTETRLGLIPATIAPYVIARLGEGRARRLVFSPRIWTAAEARDFGLVSVLTDDAGFEAALAAEVTPYLSAAPQAVASAKALARALGPIIDDTVISATIERLADMWEGAEAQEGVSAFLEKRKPWWVG
ncbi:MAG: crotonase/enoyl-CoA hydratase family protein [Hyphomicrobiaceae bacterium]|nr:crotonase/enoyl-CoA hydratase family protein [Hyphomicrobiaceae bacterium]